MNHCKELFLEDVVRVQVYYADNFPLTTSPCVPGIASVSIDDSFPTPDLDFGYNTEDIIAEEKSIVVKQSTKQSGSTLLYIYNVDATITQGNKEVAALLPRICTLEYYIVLTKSDGSKILLLSVPNTCKIDATNTIATGQLHISLSSVNNYIDLM